MNAASLILLLQAAASLLISVQNAQTTSAIMQQAVNLAGNIVQVVTQANAPLAAVDQKRNSIWPNINELLSAAYLDSTNNRVQLGPTVALLSEYTSFGDINNDGIDDAVVVVNQPGADETPHYFLAAMLNQGNTLFNIADLSLGTTLNIKSHHILNGTILIDSHKYELLGNKLNQVL